MFGVRYFTVFLRFCTVFYGILWLKPLRVLRFKGWGCTRFLLFTRFLDVNNGKVPSPSFQVYRISTVFYGIFWGKPLLLLDFVLSKPILHGFLPLWLVS